MRVFKKVCAITLNVLLWGMLGFSALVMIFVVVGKASGKAPTIFGYGVYQIVSGSMQPEINVGDVIIGKKTDVKDIKVGENIIFKYSDKIVTHKVIAINAGSFVTHGIANPDGSNENVPFSNVLAKQTGRIVGFGYFLDFLKSPFGFILIIAIPIGGLIIWQTVTLSKRLKEYRSDKSGEDAATIKEEIQALKEKLAKNNDNITEEGDDSRTTNSKDNKGQ